MSDFTVLPSGWDFAPLYQITLDDLKMFADAACELDYLSGFIDPEAPDANQRVTDMVNKLHAAVERIAGPDAGEIYAPDDGSAQAKS